MDDVEYYGGDKCESCCVVVCVEFGVLWEEF